MKALFQLLRKKVYYVAEGGYFFFRVFGVGLWFAVRKKRDFIPFSERNGYATVWHIGPLDVKPLGWHE